MSSTATDNVSRSEAVAGTASRVSENVNSVAAAVEELAASIREISQQANSSSSVATGAAGRARSTVDRVNALVNSADQIGFTQCQAQAADMDVDRAELDFLAVRPDRFEQLLSRKYPPGVLEEVAEQPIFGWPELDRLTVAADAMGNQVHLQSRI